VGGTARNRGELVRISGGEEEEEEASRAEGRRRRKCSNRGPRRARAPFCWSDDFCRRIRMLVLLCLMSERSRWRWRTGTRTDRLTVTAMNHALL